MEFEVKTSVWVSEGDIRELCKRIRRGERSDLAFEDIACGWDDCDYYLSSYIEDDVIAEAKRRIEEHERNY